MLCKDYWPTYKELKIDIEPIFKEIQDSFTKFYREKYKHRNLIWIYSLGTIILDAQFKQEHYEITMIMPQYMILKILEIEDYELSYEELQQKTKLDDETFKKNLHSLVFFFFLMNKIFMLLIDIHKV